MDGPTRAVSGAQGSWWAAVCSGGRPAWPGVGGQERQGGGCGAASGADGQPGVLAGVVTARSTLRKTPALGLWGPALSHESQCV